MRIRTVLWAVVLLVVGVFAAASVAAAMPATTEHSQDAKLDKLHAVRPIAASSASSIALPPETELLAAPVPVEPTPDADASPTPPGESAPARAPVEVVSPLQSAGTDVAAALACIRWRESRGDYQVVSRDGLYYGAYQFLRSTWDSTARAAERPDLVGVNPATVPPHEQDAMALALFEMQGSRPWGGWTC